MNTYLITASPPKYNDYVDCMVAFVDILGFNLLVKNIQSEDDFYQVGRVLFKLKEIAKYFNADDTISCDLNVTAISDSIIFTMPVHDHMSSAMSLTSILHWLQYDLLINDKMLMRGYMTRGRSYHKDNIIFGYGYSMSYEKEKEIAGPPRIVIDPSLIKEAMADNKEQYFWHMIDFVIQDSFDGYHFIDYLKPVGVQAKIPKEQLIAERNKINKIVDDNLITYAANENINGKYKWLSDYVSLTDHYIE